MNSNNIVNSVVNFYDRVHAPITDHLRDCAVNPKLHKVVQKNSMSEDINLEDCKFLFGSFIPLSINYCENLQSKVVPNILPMSKVCINHSCLSTHSSSR